MKQPINPKRKKKQDKWNEQRFVELCNKREMIYWYYKQCAEVFGFSDYRKKAKEDEMIIEISKEIDSMTDDEEDEIPLFTVIPIFQIIDMLNNPIVKGEKKYKRIAIKKIGYRTYIGGGIWFANLLEKPQIIENKIIL